MASELLQRLDRDCLVAAILTTATQGHFNHPEAVVERYFEVLTELRKRDGTSAMFTKAEQAAKVG